MAYNNYSGYLTFSGLSFSSTIFIQIALPYLIASSIGAEGYAQWIFYFSYLTFLNLVDFGVIANSQLNLLKLYKESNQNFLIFLNNSRNFLFTSCIIFILISFIIFIFTSNLALFFISIGILFNNILRFNIIVLRSMERIEYYFSYTVFLNVLIVLLVFFSFSIEKNLVFISVSYLLAQTIIMIISYLHYSLLINKLMTTSNVKELFFTITIILPSESLKFWKLTALQTINQNIVIFFLGNITTAFQLATIGVLRTIANVGVWIPSIMSAALTPRVTYLEKINDQKKITIFKKFFFIAMLLIPIPYILIILFFGEDILNIWMGNLIEYNEEIMVLLLLRMFFIVTGYAIQNYETAVETPKDAFRMELIIVSLSILLFAVTYSLSYSLNIIFAFSFLLPYIIYFMYLFLRRYI
tara:strand:+ start:3068 stop:4303 length:1236 start_codon:yes stop_codon:yes gene_type:complete